MNHWRGLDGVYPQLGGTDGRGNALRERGSKLDAHRDFVERWLVNLAEAENKQRYSQRALATALQSKFGLDISQSALSRYFKKHKLEGFFHV